MRTFHTAWILAKKDLRSIVRDRAAIAMTLAVPVMMVAVFGWIMAFAFGGGSSGMPKVTLNVIDLSNSPESIRLIDHLSSHEMVTVQLLAHESSSDGAAAIDTAERSVRNGDAHHVLILPVDYASQAQSFADSSSILIRDPRHTMEDRVIQLALMQATMMESGSNVWINLWEKRLTEEGMAPESVASIREWMSNIQNKIAEVADADEANLSNHWEDASTDSNDRFDSDDMLDFMTDLVPVKTVDVTPPSKSIQVTHQQAQSVAGMSVMMLLFALTSCGNVLITERETGTLRRLFAHPIPRHSILLGKFLFTFIVGLIQMTVMFSIGELLFRVGLFRDPITLLILMFSWVAAGSAFGMFLASACRTSKQSESLATLLILAMAALGGCWFPLQLMSLPPALEMLCKSTMTYWAMTGFQGLLWNELAWHTPKILLALAAQWLWAVAFTTGAVLLFRRNYLSG